MGQLRFAASGETYQLGPRCLLGRGSKCDVRVVDPRVSGEHAVVSHNGSRWELKDLGSRNGTFLGRRKMASGDRASLAVGSKFTLGGSGLTFELIDADPPVPVARNLRTDAQRQAAKGMLALPDDDEPAITIFMGSDGEWVAESSNGERKIQDGELILAGGDEWRVDLPSFTAATIDTLRMGPTIDMIKLRFVVSRDEEHVEVTVVIDQQEKVLPPRSFHYMLLTLARAWLDDAEAPPGDRGWVERERLCRMLSIDAGNLNVDIYRARGQLAALGIHGAAGLIVRRTGSGQLRLGVQQVEVVSPRVNGQP